MAWDFETDPEFQKKLDWATEFVRDVVQPLDMLYPNLEYTPLTPELRKIVDPMKDKGLLLACSA